VTDSWVKIQGILNVSLTALLEKDEPGLMKFRPTFGVPDHNAKGTDVFVLMPFAEHLKPIYDIYISRVIKGLGLSVNVARNVFTPHDIMKDVWTAINRSRVLIADCTGNNPNVFYEVGMAHTIGMPVIFITQHKEEMPFDISRFRYIHYEDTPPGMEKFEGDLARTIRDVLGIGEDLENATE
jgi:hypothetical protein